MHTSQTHQNLIDMVALIMARNYADMVEGGEITPDELKMAITQRRDLLRRSSVDAIARQLLDELPAEEFYVA